MGKYAKQFSYLTHEMVEESKKLIEAMGLPMIQAPMESDAQMAYMNKNKDADYCGSSDFDCLLHAAPYLVTNLTLSQKKRLPSGAVIKISPELISLKETLKSLCIDQEQLIIIGILCGTDYNPGGIRGIGPKKALKLVKENKNYDRLFESLNADFDWKEIFNLFISMRIDKDYKLKWNKPDPNKIKSILVKEHDFSEQRVDSILNKLLNQEVKSQTGLDKWFK